MPGGSPRKSGSSRPCSRVNGSTTGSSGRPGRREAWRCAGGCEPRCRGTAGRDRRPHGAPDIPTVLHGGHPARSAAEETRRSQCRARRAGTSCRPTICSSRRPASARYKVKFILDPLIPFQRAAISVAVSVTIAARSTTRRGGIDGGVQGPCGRAPHHAGVTDPQCLFYKTP